MTMKVMRIIARSNATLAAKIQLAIENRRLIEIRYSGDHNAWEVLYARVK
jgi:hypothetical protein